MKPDQIEYQRAAYDGHYPQMADAVRDQLQHPLLSSFYDRLAERILDAGIPDGGHQASTPLRLFEAGCGEGLVASAVQRVARRRELAFSYTGTDLSTAGIELARSVVQGDLHQGEAVEVVSSLPPGSQDIIWAKNLLHHLADPAEFLRHAARAVGPRGRVVVIEPRMWCPVHWLNLVWFRQERYQFQGYRRNLAAFRAAGLRVLRRQEFGWLPYELALATRFHLPRRVLATGNPAAIHRVSAVDDWLTAKLPDLALYMVSALATVEGAEA